MYQFRFDESAWPIVMIGAWGVGTIKDAEEYIARWERWLAREEPFALMMMSLHEEQPRPDQEVRELVNRWHKENRERVAERCVGIATVVRSARLLAIYNPVAARYTRPTMGYPGQLFATRKEARAWLEERLRDAGLRKVQGQA